MHISLHSRIVMALLIIKRSIPILLFAVLKKLKFERFVKSLMIKFFVSLESQAQVPVVVCCAYQLTVSSIGILPLVAGSRSTGLSLFFISERVFAKSKIGSLPTKKTGKESYF